MYKETFFLSIPIYTLFPTKEQIMKTNTFESRKTHPKTIRRRVFLLVIISFMTVFFGAGCDGGGVMPPATVTFRYSNNPFIASSKVMQVTNRSGKETLVMRLDVKNEKKQESGFHIFKLKPGETYEIGTMEMGWKFETGETYSIKADGYVLSIDGTVP